jgi:hypothetical protein
MAAVSKVSMDCGECFLAKYDVQSCIPCGAAVEDTCTAADMAKFAELASCITTKCQVDTMGEVSLKCAACVVAAGEDGNKGKRCMDTSVCGSDEHNHCVALYLSEKFPERLSKAFLKKCALYQVCDLD